MQKFVETLEKQHVKEENVRSFLRDIGLNPAMNRPFKAELTLMGGTKLNLPDDLLGKVVVIDFWATWCPPCVEAMPRMKELYEKYKSQGVEIVGISLDTSRFILKRFIKKQQLDWIHTFSGKGLGDPTAKAYGVSSIPSVWVVGKNGKVISDSAMGRLERILQVALKARTPASARPTKRETGIKPKTNIR